MKKSWRWLLGALGLVLAWHALRTVAWPGVWALLERFGPAAILLILAVNLLMLPLMTARWWLLLRALGWPVGLFSLSAYRTAAGAVSYFTPGPHFGGEPLSIFCLHSRQGIPLTSAATSVALDRLLELLASLSVLAFCLIYLTVAKSGPFAAIHGMPVIIAVLGIFTAILATLFTGKKPFSRSVLLSQKLTGRFSPPAAGRFQPLIDLIAQAEGMAESLYRGHHRHFLMANLLSLVHWLGIFTEFWLMSLLLGLPLSLWHLTAVVAVARLAFYTPLPAGIGVLESALPWLTAVLGLGGSLGLSLCLLIRCRDLLISLAGFGLAMQYLTCSGKVAIVKDNLDHQGKESHGRR
jgi:uncharacterized protein (TIRG00374 family)